MFLLNNECINYLFYINSTFETCKKGVANFCLSLTTFKPKFEELSPPLVGLKVRPIFKPIFGLKCLMNTK